MAAGGAGRLLGWSRGSLTPRRWRARPMGRRGKVVGGQAVPVGLSGQNDDRPSTQGLSRFGTLQAATTTHALRVANWGERLSIDTDREPTTTLSQQLPMR
eukprot:scaffold63097_cov63-Phaeocystis_antarctica.AAC.4